MSKKNIIGIIVVTILILSPFYGIVFNWNSSDFYHEWTGAAILSTVITSFIVCPIIGYKMYTKGIIKKWVVITIPIILVPAFWGNALFLTPLINTCYEKGDLHHFYDVYRYDIFSIGGKYECLQDPATQNRITFE